VALTRAEDEKATMMKNAGCGFRVCKERGLMFK